MPPQRNRRARGLASSASLGVTSQVERKSSARLSATAKIKNSVRGSMAPSDERGVGPRWAA